MDDISDNAGFEMDQKIVIAWRFYHESLARIYQVRLKEAGIQSFLSNSLTTNLIPFGEGGILLHVQEKDLEQSVRIIKSTQQLFQHRADDHFHEADLGDIEYEKEVVKFEKKLAKVRLLSWNSWVLLILAAFILALSISYLLNFR